MRKIAVFVVDSMAHRVSEMIEAKGIVNVCGLVIIGFCSVDV